MLIFSKKYSDEALYDLHRDISESLMDEFNPIVKDIPKDKYSFRKGTFKVVIEWSDDES